MSSWRYCCMYIGALDGTMQMSGTIPKLPLARCTRSPRLSLQLVKLFAYCVYARVCVLLRECYGTSGRHRYSFRCRSIVCSSCYTCVCVCVSCCANKHTHRKTGNYIWRKSMRVSTFGRGDVPNCCGSKSTPIVG